MEILVTGGAGFIGSNLAVALIKEGHNVTVLDNFHSGSEDNLKGLQIRLVKGTPSEIKKLDIGKPQVIFHEGIYSSTPMYKKNPRLVASVLDDFICLLEFAKENNSKIVFAATSSLYNGIKPPHREDVIPGVTDFYTEARIAMERMAELYNKLYGVRVIGLRYFSVYGPHEEAKGTYANLISQFLWAILKGENPVIYGDGTQTRDFTYIDDVVRANLLAMDSKTSFGIYNVGTGKNYTLNRMVEILNQKLGTSIKPAYVENKMQNYVQETLADTSKAEKELGFKSQISLEVGIERLIAYTKIEKVK